MEIVLYRFPLNLNVDLPVSTIPAGESLKLRMGEEMLTEEDKPGVVTRTKQTDINDCSLLTTQVTALPSLALAVSLSRICKVTTVCHPVASFLLSVARGLGFK